MENLEQVAASELEEALRRVKINKIKDLLKFKARCAAQIVFATAELARCQILIEKVSLCSDVEQIQSIN